MSGSASLPEVPVRAVGDVKAAHAEAMQAMINDERFSDLVFVVECRQVFSHKPIVVAQCPYLAAQLSGPFKDSQGPIHVEGIGYDAFLSVILGYFYTGCLNKPDARDVFGVLKLADLWQLHAITAMVAKQMTQSFLGGDVCLQGLNLAHQRCSFVNGEITLDSPELWSVLYQRCISHIRQQFLTILNADAAALLYIETYELMGNVLQAIDFEKLPAETIANVGGVFMQWLRRGAESERSGSSYDTLFEIMTHTHALQSEQISGHTSMEICIGKVLDDIAWEDEAHSVSYAQFTHSIKLKKTIQGSHLGVYVGQRIDCAFLNKWTFPTDITIALLSSGKRTRRGGLATNTISRYFHCCYDRQQREREKRRGLEKFVPLSQLLDEEEGFVREGRFTLEVWVRVLQHPLSELLSMFAAVSFQQILHHPHLPSVPASVLPQILQRDCLDATSEADVLQALSTWSKHRQHLPDELLECVRFAYTPSAELRRLYRHSAAFHSDAFHQKLVDCLKHNPKCLPRRSYVDKRIQITADVLVRGSLGDANEDESSVVLEHYGIFQAAEISCSPCRCGLLQTPDEEHVTEKHEGAREDEARSRRLGQCVLQMCYSVVASGGYPVESNI